MQALAELLLLAGAQSRNEYRVVAGYGSDHLGPTGRIDGHRHALRGAHGGSEHGQVGAGGLRSAHELLERRKIFLYRSPGFRQHVAIAELGHSELAQTTADARLGGDMAQLAQHRDQLRLATDRLL